MSASKTTASQSSRAGGTLRGDAADTMRLRAADRRDLGPINTLIAAAMERWNFSARVKRLSLPLYQYDAQDFAHFDIVVAETGNGELAGVAAMETADASESPQDQPVALLHGLYVDPARHGDGIGSRLLEHMQSLAASRHYRGVLVKANPAAASFFEARGFQRLPVADVGLDYPYRYFKSL